MKAIVTTAAIATVLGLAATANAWLGDSKDALVERYGKPTLVQLTTGDVPTQKGYYAELKENFNTNIDLIGWTGTNYNDIGYGMDLVETRTRYTFEKDGLQFVAYLGTVGEAYDGADFSGRTAREIINSGTAWQKNTHGDKVAIPVPLSPSVIDAFLEDNKGGSTWADAWQSSLVPGTWLKPSLATRTRTISWQPSFTPGTWLKRTADKMRLAIAHGTSEHEIYQIEVQMVDDATRAQQQ
jgi:hypothetical protein